MSKPNKKAMKELAAWAGYFLARPVELLPLAGDGGARLYFRIKGENLIAMHGPDPAENMAYLSIGRHLRFKSVRLPRLEHYNLAKGFFILQDLGDSQLLNFAPCQYQAYYLSAVEELARFHKNGLADFNIRWCYQTKIYDSKLIYEREFCYFLDFFITKFLSVEPLPKGLLSEARQFSRAALPKGGGNVLMHRDFQLRNIMINNDRVFIIDWQGARLGPAAYDLASFLEDHPYEDLEDDFKNKLIKTYLKKSSGASPGEKQLRLQLDFLAGARLMQVLGAYAKFTLAGKTAYTTAMYHACRRLFALFEQKIPAKFPRLREVAQRAWRKLETETSS